MSEALITVHDLHKTYRLGRVDVPVLRGVSLSVQRGEFLAVLGASGSGKSTLLHLLGGLDRPDRRGAACGRCGGSLSGVARNVCPKCGNAFERTGVILFDGVSLTRASARELDRFRARRVGFVFQFYHLLPELSVLDNVLVAAMVRHGRLGYARQRSAARERARALLDAFGLSHRLAHRPAELSGGERQRVAIARALINEPDVLLADEPTGNLDRATGDRILDAIASLRERGIGGAGTIVMVTHDAEVAARADRLVRLQDGLVVDEGAPRAA